MSYHKTHEATLLLYKPERNACLGIEDASEEALDLLGLDMETLLAMDPADLFVDQETLDQVEAVARDQGNGILSKIQVKGRENPIQLDLGIEYFMMGNGYALVLRLQKPVLTNRILNRVEADLLRSTSILGSILNNTHMHIACMDKDFNFIIVNQKYALTDNKTPDFFIGKNHFDLYPNSENEAIFRNVVETGEPFIVYEKPFVYPENPERGSSYWDWSLMPVKDEEGNITQLVLTLANVTERVTSKRQIEKSEELIKKSMAAGRSFAFEWDLQTDTIARRGECDMILGLIDELVFYDTGKRYQTTIIDEDLKHYQQTIESLRPADNAYSVTYSVINPDDSLVTIEETGRGFFNKKGQLTRIEGISVDITRRRKAEEALVASEKEIRMQLTEIENIYRIAPIGMCMFDRYLRFIRVNDRMAEINGIPAKDHLGKTPSDVIPDLAGQAEEVLRKVMETGKPVLNQVVTGETPARPGVKRIWNESWFPLYNDTGAIYGVGTVIEDITEKERAEEQLRDLNETLEQRIEERTGKIMMLANQLRAMNIELNRVEQRERIRLARILHDYIQQYLISVRIQLGWIKRKSSEKEVKERAKEMISILNEIIESSRSLTVEIHPPVLTVSGLAESLYWLGDYMHEKYGFRVKVDADNMAEPATEEARYLLFECVRELLFNAMKHSGTKKASVTMSLIEERFTCITVEDRGKGFNTELLNYHSSEFTSFGLFSIQQRLAYFEGSMEIDSTPSQGTRVTLIMPIVTKRSSSEDPSSIDESRSNVSL